MARFIKDALPTMIALAHEHSEVSRLQLAGMLADVFLYEEAPLTLREEEQLNDLINLLVFNASPQVKEQLAKKFSDMTKMPRGIAAALAQDDLMIARPVLITATCLSDADLIRVIEDKGIAHATAIAQRERISEVVADALVTTGDVGVMQVVVENLGAELSPLALRVVSDAARHSQVLRKPLLSRNEATVDVVLKLYWWLEEDLRRYTLSRFGITSGQIDRALSKTIGAFLDDHAQEKGNDKIMIQVANWIEAHGALTLQVLPQVLRMGHYRLFNILLGRLAGLPLTLVDAIMAGVGGRGLAAVCRAIGVDKINFVSLFLLSRGGRPGDQIVHPREMEYALTTFDRMTAEIAKDLLRTWKADPSYFVEKEGEKSFVQEIASNL
ncbi:MAG: DUF2336 domain-containing protein [Alphaproteobacteria bacterium]|nr:DUF2336 domain-containing protein [Alphaproteobacteria bacterium]